MGAYIAKRLMQTVAVLLIVSFFCFILLSLMPGDPVYAMLGEDITQEQYDMAYQELGLDKPLFTRYLSWLADALHGDLGTSMKLYQPIGDLLAQKLPVTLYLAFLAVILSLVIGVLFGVICAVFRGKKVDTIITVIANISSCMPPFWLGLLLMFVFSVQLQWLPTFGFTWPWDDFGKSMLQLIMPLSCLVLPTLASTTRQARSSMLEVIRQDYIRTARSKGLKKNRVIYVHALKNGVVPVLTLLGMRIGMLVGGSVFVESVFSIPGMGLMILQAIQSRDVPVVQASVLVIAVIIGVVNLIVDILYAYLDPKIRFV